MIYYVVFVISLVTLCFHYTYGVKLTKKVGIIGGGPAGLAAAVMIAKKYPNYDITVYDRLSPPPSSDSIEWENSERSYTIGLNGRGQNALKKLGLMKRIDDVSVKVYGRLDWSPGTPIDQPNESIFTDKSYDTKVLQRDRIVSCILEEIAEEFSDRIKIKHNIRCTNIDWDNTDTNEEKAHLSFLDADNTNDNYNNSHNNGGVNNVKESFDLVLGCDGAASAIRDILEELDILQVKRYKDTNIRVYKTLPIRIPSTSTWRKDLNLSCRTKDDINLDALPTKEGFHLGVILFRPDDERVLNLKNGADARAFFEKYLPQFSPLIDDKDLDVFAKKPISKLPRFLYTGPVLHKGRSTVLLGDAIHCVKPYFGQGVNSAFEDVIYLQQALEKTEDIGESLQYYSERRAIDAKSLVTLSHRLDGGFLTFILPIIIDAYMSKTFPKFFTRNVIALLQDEKRTFTDVLKRKRAERIVQSIMAIGVVTASGVSLKFLFKLLRSVLI